MEPRVPINLPSPSTAHGAEMYYEHAWAMCEISYAPMLEHLRKVQLLDFDGDRFWMEYIWCTYVSGFNSKIVAKKFDSLLTAYGHWLVVEETWDLVRDVIGNRAKYKACRTVAKLMQDYYVQHGSDLWWICFKIDKLATIDKIGTLPWMGAVMRHHLARNLGLDTVKPDRHLVRLARHFGFEDPYALCKHIAAIYGERIGVVDVIFFYGGSEWGTLHLEDPALDPLQSLALEFSTPIADTLPQSPREILDWMATEYKPVG